MAKSWNSRELKALQEEWDRKLAESGFKDAEETRNGERILKHSAHWALCPSNQRTAFEQKAEYFHLLSQCIHDEKHFEDDSDRLIMEKTADGWTIQEISRELLRLQLRKFNRHTIMYVRRRYETRWKIRHWKPEQMVSRKVRTK